MTDSLYKQILAEMKAEKRLLTTMSPDVIKAEVLRRVIYRKANFISQGTKLTGLENFGSLDVRYQFPSYMTVGYPISEGARGEHSKTTWTDFTMTLDKAEGSFMITDEAVMRGLQRIQYNTGVRRLSEAIANKIDDNIVDTLYAGQGGTNAATQAWDNATTTAAQITGDIKTGIAAVMAAEGVTEEDIKQMALVLPLGAWTPLLDLREISNIKWQLADWLNKSFGLTIHPTKNSTLLTNKSGLLLIKGSDTAVHGQLRAPADVPLVEIKRIEGVGREYVVRSFFNTKVVPDSSSTATSTRIYKITSILT